MKISTKTGDEGKTGLMFGKRVSKSDARVCAYGAVDDFSATLGLARAFSPVSLSTFLLGIQENLIILMTELAIDQSDWAKVEEKKIRLLGEKELGELEAKIDELEGDGSVFNNWSHSGENPLQAALEMSRTRCRFAEREIVKLHELSPLPRIFPITYINRLSDLLWLLANSAAKDV